MRHLRRATLVTLLAVTAGCNQDVVTPSGPVTVTFVTPTYTGAGGTAVSHGTVVMDGVDTLRIPEDSLVVQRGGHSLSALLDIAYLPTLMAGQIAPSGSRFVVNVPLPASCRTWAGDAQICYGGETIASRGHLHTFCPANDFGDFCSWFPDSYQLGLSWPAFIPITFELGVLFAALGAVGGMLALNRLPMHYHPLFRSKVFERVTDDAFFISIESWDPRFDPSATRTLLQSLGASNVDLLES